MRKYEVVESINFVEIGECVNFAEMVESKSFLEIGGICNYYASLALEIDTPAPHMLLSEKKR